MRGRSASMACPSMTAPAAGSATCRRSAGCTRRCGCSTSCSTSGACTTWTRAAARRAGEQLCRRLGLSERLHSKVEELSLGNQQRVQLAAALVHEPDLLVLDEPFSGLDPVGVDDLSETLAERAAAGATIVFSSHQLDLVEHLCEEVAIVDHGRLVASGAVSELAHGGPPGSPCGSPATATGSLGRGAADRRAPAVGRRRRDRRRVGARARVAVGRGAGRGPRRPGGSSSSGPPRGGCRRCSARRSGAR